MAANPARKGPRDKPEDAVKPKRLHIPTLAVLSAELRTLVLNLCLLALVLIMVPVVGLQFLKAPVIIDTLAVPPALAQRGLSGEVASNRLWDGLAEVEALASSSKEGLTAIPKSQRVDFAIPDSGVSIDSLVYYVRQFFHLYQTRISGEFQCADPDCRPEGMTLRIRILRDRLEVIQMPPMGSMAEADYFRAAAARVLAVLDPFLAAAAQVQSNPEAGMAAAERLVRQGAADAVWADNLIGNTRMTMGDTDGAIAAFQAALKIDPGFVIAQTNLGSALVAKGDYAAAGKLFDQVALAHPDDRYLALGRYRLALAQGQTEAAIVQALKADAVDPGKAMYLYLAAQAAYGANDTARAVGFLGQALQVAPDDEAAVSLLTLIHQVAGEYDKAEAVLARALTVSPDNVGFLTTRAQVLGVMHRFDEALVVVERALVLQPGDGAAQKVRAATLQALGRHQDALVQLEGLLRAGGDDVELGLMQGQSMAALGQKAQAVAAYEAVIAADPEGAYGMMAKAYLGILQAAP